MLAGGCRGLRVLRLLDCARSDQGMLWGRPAAEYFAIMFFFPARKLGFAARGFQGIL